MCNWFCSEKMIRSGFDPWRFSTQHPSLIETPPAQFFWRQNLWHIIPTFETGILQKQSLWLYFANNTKSNLFLLIQWAPYFLAEL